MDDTRIQYKGGFKALLADKDELLPYWDYRVDEILVNSKEFKLDPSIVTVGDLYEYYNNLINGGSKNE